MTWELALSVVVLIIWLGGAFFFALTYKHWSFLNPTTYVPLKSQRFGITLAWHLLLLMYIAERYAGRKARNHLKRKKL